MTGTNGHHGRSNGAPKPLSGGSRVNGGSHRLPPQNIEAEEGVIGAVLLDGRTLDEVVKVLPNAEHFYRDKHQVIWRVIVELYRANKPADLVSVQDELDRAGKLESVGGMYGLASFVEGVPHAANAAYHAGIVREKSLGRDLIDLMSQVLMESYAGQFTSHELLAAAQIRMFDLADGRTEDRVKAVGEILPAVMEMIDRRSRGEVPSGTTTPWNDLDLITGGFHPEQLIIIAARPSIGKSSIALNIADYVAFELQKRVLFVSLEMGRELVVERLIASRSPIASHKLASGVGITEQEIRKIGDANDVMMRESLSLLIDDSSAQGMLQVMATARGISRRSGLGLIVVDYIQLMDAEDPRVSRQEQVAKISRRLKQLARELRVPVVALSQLNRLLENREDHRPRLADLKESGAIEQDADIVMLLHQPDYFDGNGEKTAVSETEVIVAKNRNGQTGTAKLGFYRAYMKFVEMERRYGAPPEGNDRAF
jgi:replicative DNA helicase